MRSVVCHDRIDSGGDGSVTAPRTPERAGAREWAGLAVLTLAVSLIAVDGTVLALAIPALTRALSATSTEVLWIGDIYSFALAGLLVTMGNVADRIGRKRLLLTGSLGFGVASAIAAFSPSPEVLIAARALLGVAGATLMPSTLSLIRGMFRDARQRTRAIAIWSAGATGGAALGPLVGGWLLEHFWWGSVFLINVPVMVLVIGLGLPLLTESRNPSRAPIDLLSALLSFAAIVPLVYAVKTVVKEGPSTPVLLGAVIGLAAGLAFVVRQRWLTHPLIDVSLFARPAFSGSVAANAVSIFALSGLLFFFSQYLQLVRGMTPLVAGLAELPGTLAAILGVTLVAWMVTRLGRGRAIGAMLLTTALGMAGVALAESMPGYVWLALALVVTGAGISIASTIAIDTVVTVVPPARAGAASSISETAYELGTALGIAVLGSVLGAAYRARVEVPPGTPSHVAEAMSDSLAAAVTTIGPDHPGLLASAQHAFTGAMQTTALTAAAVLAAVGVMALVVIPSSVESGEPAAHG